jgi:DNA-binding transcriptional MerR regulator
MPTDLRRPMRTYTIRQLCLEFKCTPRALRFYEDKGLLNPARDGMNRVYSYRDRARLQLILRGKRVGLSLAEIGEILDLYDADESGAQEPAQVQGAHRRPGAAEAGHRRGHRPAAERHRPDGEAAGGNPARPSAPGGRL